MIVLPYDTETEAHRPGCKAPPMACLTYQGQFDNAPSILHWTEAGDHYSRWLHDPQVLLTGHFVAFDSIVCMNQWPDLSRATFDAYEKDRITCTMLREKLYDIACGIYRGFFNSHGEWERHDYGLDMVALRRAGIRLKKDGYRRRYGEVRDYPISEWPRRAEQMIAEARVMVNAGVDDKDLIAIAQSDPQEILIYPLEDARATRAVHLKQDDAKRAAGVDVFADQFRQARASFWLTLMTTWGVRTYAEGVARLREQVIEEIDELTVDLVAEGLVREDGSKDMKVSKARMLDVMGWKQIIEVDANKKKTYRYEKLRPDARRLSKTKAGDVSLSRDSCELSGDELLEDFGNRGQHTSVLAKDVPMLEAGMLYPIHPRIDLAASGRITMSKPNLANLRRVAGIREAIVPRDECVFVQADYPALELRTLAQVLVSLFGKSKLADMLNAGIDPHLKIAARILGMTYEDAKKNKKRKDVDDARQIGKVFNFGKPGGLGHKRKKDGSDPTLITFARKTYGVELTVEQVEQYSKDWFAELPEMNEFFEYVGRLTRNEDKEATIVQLFSERIRGGAPFCAACNTWFQGLGADATKAAGFEIARACYVDKKSPLFASRIVNYIYDEFILETPERRIRNTWPAATAAARELSRIMRDEANKWLPDVPFTEVEPLLMRMWSKDAEPILDADDLLVPWEPSLAGLIKMGEAVNTNTSLRVAA